MQIAEAAHKPVEQSWHLLTRPTVGAAEQKFPESIFLCTVAQPLSSEGALTWVCISNFPSQQVWLPFLSQPLRINVTWELMYSLGAETLFAVNLIMNL